MKKLTIKELAPYLPYKLEVLYDKSDNTEKLIVMGIHDDGGRIREEHENDKYPGFSLAVIRKESHRYRSYGYFYVQSAYKPLLRPLSQLTQEIEHNGERFVPINNLKHLYGWDYLWYEALGEITNFNVNKLKYACLKLLLEWHFDVFGLIDRGLALPIDGKEVK